MAKVKGLAGKILRVNLSQETIDIEETPLEIMDQYLGGRGLGVYYLNQEVAPSVDPLGPENKLIFMNGPLAGSPIPGSNKVNVTFKSPLTNTYFYSLCGGHWGPELKFAGFDGLIIEGQAAEPVYLWIDDDQIAFKSAQKIWGKSIQETDQLIKKELGGDENIKVAAIGRAGENLNKFACITTDCYREFGRGGGGTVMGAMNLKAIAIRGTKDIEFADLEGLMELTGVLYHNLKNHPKAQERRMYGTPEMVKIINNLGFWCTRNFSEGYFEDGHMLEGPKMRDDIVVGDAACYGCPVACSKSSKTLSKKYGDVLLEGPEFETLGLLGPNCGISDWEVILKATEICDSYGMDTITAGACVSLAMEAFEKGIINLEQTGGLELKFGNGEAMLRLLEMMASKEGLGAILAEGPKYAGEKLGAPELAMESKGLAFAVYDPRGCKGMALTYATSPKGAHHMLAPTMGAEIPGDRFATNGKGKLVREQQFSMCVVDSLGLCATMRTGISLEHQAKAFHLVTGLQIDEKLLYQGAERIMNLERMYNVQMGLSRKDDTLPRRFTHEPMPSGPSQGQKIELDVMLDDYYEQMGWDRDGIPTTAKLAELGINN